MDSSHVELLFLQTRATMIISTPSSTSPTITPCEFSNVLENSGLEPLAPRSFFAREILVVVDEWLRSMSRDIVLVTVHAFLPNYAYRFSLHVAVRVARVDGFVHIVCCVEIDGCERMRAFAWQFFSSFIHESLHFDRSKS